MIARVDHNRTLDIKKNMNNLLIKLIQRSN